MPAEFQIDFSQLWDKERQTLAECANRVPDHGIIAEIGTAQGGSAFIFHKVTSFRDVRIYSYDIAPSAQAYEHLKNTNVTIIAQPSVQGAAEWRQVVGEPMICFLLMVVTRCNTCSRTSMLGYPC